MNLVFDFGAVLFDWQPEQLCQRLFPDRAATPAAAHALAQALFRHPDWLAFDQGLLTLDEIEARSVARLHLPAAAVHTLMHGIGDWLAPLPESVALLQRLLQLRASGAAVAGQPLRLYYLSNMPEPYVHTLRARHACIGAFDGGLFSSAVQLIKPDPALFARLEQCYALVAAHCVLIDDQGANVAAAQAHGWRGIRFTSAAQVAQALLALGLPL